MPSLRERMGLGRRAEEELSGRLGADLTPASGALDGAKGDMQAGDFLIESKATENGSMSVKYGWLNQVHMCAREKGLDPALSVQFVSADGRPRKNGAWVMISEEDFRELLTYREEAVGG